MLQQLALLQRLSAVRLVARAGFFVIAGSGVRCAVAAGRGVPATERAPGAQGFRTPTGLLKSIPLLRCAVLSLPLPLRADSPSRAESPAESLLGRAESLLGPESLREPESLLGAESLLGPESLLRPESLPELGRESLLGPKSLAGAESLPEPESLLEPELLLLLSGVVEKGHVHLGPLRRQPAAPAPTSPGHSVSSIAVLAGPLPHWMSL
jgi:hypothetical protein